MNNGCRLSWLIAPWREKVFIYYSPLRYGVVGGFDKKICGDDVLPGFEMDLTLLKKH